MERTSLGETTASDGRLDLGLQLGHQSSQLVHLWFFRRREDCNFARNPNNLFPDASIFSITIARFVSHSTKWERVLTKKNSPTFARWWQWNASKARWWATRTISNSGPSKPSINDTAVSKLERRFSWPLRSSRSGLGMERVPANFTSSGLWRIAWWLTWVLLNRLTILLLWWKPSHRNLSTDDPDPSWRCIHLTSTCDKHDVCPVCRNRNEPCQCEDTTPNPRLYAKIMHRFEQNTPTSSPTPTLPPLHHSPTHPLLPSTPRENPKGLLPQRYVQCGTCVCDHSTARTIRNPENNRCEKRSNFATFTKNPTNQKTIARCPCWRSDANGHKKALNVTRIWDVIRFGRHVRFADCTTDPKNFALASWNCPPRIDSALSFLTNSQAAQMSVGLRLSATLATPDNSAQRIWRLMEMRSKSRNTVSNLPQNTGQLALDAFPVTLLWLRLGSDTMFGMIVLHKRWGLSFVTLTADGAPRCDALAGLGQNSMCAMEHNNRWDVPCFKILQSIAETFEMDSHAVALRLLWVNLWTTKCGSHTFTFMEMPSNC